MNPQRLKSLNPKPYTPNPRTGAALTPHMLYANAEESRIGGEHLPVSSEPVELCFVFQLLFPPV